MGLQNSGFTQFAAADPHDFEARVITVPAYAMVDDLSRVSLFPPQR